MPGNTKGTPQARGQTALHTNLSYSHSLAHDPSRIRCMLLRCALSPRGAEGRGQAALPGSRRLRSRRQPRHPRASAAQQAGKRAWLRHLLLHPRAKSGGMFPAQEEADRTVFVGNLEARVREEILYELFLQVPSVGKGHWRRRGASSLKRSWWRGAPEPFGVRPPSRPNLCFDFNLVRPWRTCLLVSSWVVKWLSVRSTPVPSAESWGWALTGLRSE